MIKARQHNWQGNQEILRVPYRRHSFFRRAKCHGAGARARSRTGVLFRLLGPQCNLSRDLDSVTVAGLSTSIVPL
jgi:hypothetical protein